MDHHQIRYVCMPTSYLSVWNIIVTITPFVTEIWNNQLPCVRISFLQKYRRGGGGHNTNNKYWTFKHLFYIVEFYRYLRCRGHSLTTKCYTCLTHLRRKLQMSRPMWSRVSVSHAMCRFYLRRLFRVKLPNYVKMKFDPTPLLGA